MEQMTMNSARLMFSDFLSRHVKSIPDICNVPIEKTGLTKDLDKYDLKFTHFNDIYDTLLYSKLIEKAIQLNKEVTEIIDLGAGSSIPTLLAVKNSKRLLHIKAVDVDPEALQVSQKNAENMGMRNDYSFHLGDMKSVIHSGLVQGRGAIIVSNPPYVPVPETLHDYHLVPVHGGHDGSEYIMELLNSTYPEGTTLALFWGSLVNPKKIIPLIEERYDVLYVQAVKVHFGNYTTIPEIHEHLEKLKATDDVYYENSPEGERQIVIGTILKPKPASLEPMQ